MKLRFVFVFVFMLIVLSISAQTTTDSVRIKTDSVSAKDTIAVTPDQLVRFFMKDSTIIENVKPHDSIVVKKPIKDTINHGTKNFRINYAEIFNIKKLLNETELIPIDTLILQNNPLFIDLVYRDAPFCFDWKSKLKPYNYFYEYTYDTIQSSAFKTFRQQGIVDIISDLRKQTYRRNMLSSPVFFAFRADELPSIDGLKSKVINSVNLERVRFVDNLNTKKPNDSKIVLEKINVSPWTAKANSMVQFSQNYVSKNWYQGGSEYISILGILNGKLNYDNKKNVQWENNMEWRVGFNSVEDAVRLLNTNDDIFKINSKLGVKAGGNFFYSSALDCSAQFFNNYKSASSTELKASFLTPIRLNIGVGMDYKYKKLFSIMVSPVSYKYIYALNTETVPSTIFGIPDGEKYLSQFGSSFKAQFAYSPTKEIQIDSRLNFYTNYEKVEIDWEIVSNFTINRYLSTRLSLNPRYDNTVILPDGHKAEIQFKELLSFGFSYRLLN